MSQAVDEFLTAAVGESRVRPVERVARRVTPVRTRGSWVEIPS
jgi:hypothetical protein